MSSRDDILKTPPLPEYDEAVAVVITPEPIAPPSQPIASPPQDQQQLSSMMTMISELRDGVFALGYQLQQQQEAMPVSRGKKLQAPPESEEKTPEPPSKAS